MKTIALGVAIVLPLAGCAAATPAESTTAGRPAYHIECAATRLDLCYSKANKLCPVGFEEVKFPHVVVPQQPAGTGGTASAKPPVVPNTLYVSCK